MLAYIARLGFALFTAAILLLHFLSPEFNALAQGISYYALGQFGWLFTVSLLFLGFAAAALVPSCGAEVPTHRATPDYPFSPSGS